MKITQSVSFYINASEASYISFELEAILSPFEVILKKTVEAIWGLENSNVTFYVLLVEEGLQMSRCQMWISGLSVKLFFKMMSL